MVQLYSVWLFQLHMKLKEEKKSAHLLRVYMQNIIVEGLKSRRSRVNRRKGGDTCFHAFANRNKRTNSKLCLIRWASFHSISLWYYIILPPLAASIILVVMHDSKLCGLTNSPATSQVKPSGTASMIHRRCLHTRLSMMVNDNARD